MALGAAVRGAVATLVLIAGLGPSWPHGRLGHGEDEPFVSTVSRSQRLAVGPRRGVRCPAKSVVLRPGQRLQAAIDDHAEGTTFCFRAGIYRLKQPLIPRGRDVFIGEYGAVLRGSKIVSDWSRDGARWRATGQTQEGEVIPGVPCLQGIECNRPEGIFIDGRPLIQVTGLADVRRGTFFFDYANDVIYIGTEPKGHRIEASIASGAFRATDTNAPGVVIRNLVIQQFANPSRTGAIWTTVSSGWRVINNDVGFNHGVGIFHHSGAMIERNNVHHNGQVGLGAFEATRVLVRQNEIARNGIGGFAGWEAGGAKYSGTTDLRIVGNYVHDNGYHGLWTDTNNVDTLYARNMIVGNRASGIFHEAAGSCRIRDNRIVRNGSGVVIGYSSRVEVSGNTVAGNREWAVRLYADETAGSDLADNLVHDNVIKMREGSLTGLATGNVSDPNPYFTSKNNRFRDNTYFVQQLSGRYWTWQGGTKTWSEWQTAGQDVDGTLRPL